MFVLQVLFLSRFRLDNLRNAASADTKLSSALKEKDVKIAEMEARYWKRQYVNYSNRLFILSFTFAENRTDVTKNLEFCEFHNVL